MTPLNQFFPGRNNYQRVLKRYSHALTRPMTDLNRFSRLAPYLIWKSMNLAGASVMVLDRENRCYRVRAGEGNGEALIGRTVPEDSPLILELTRRKKRIERGSLPPGDLGEKIRAEMDALKSDLIIPSVSESEYFHVPTLLSTINLGKKPGETGFLEEDMDFLETMANQASISIEYAFILEEFRRNQEQLLKSEKLAALGTTAAGIAHELKNPLTALQIIAQSMVGNWDKPEFKETVMNLFPSEVERMKFIIDGLSDYSKAHELKIEPVDVSVIIDKTLAILGYEIRKNNVNVAKDYPSENLLCLADKNRLIQVFMNLIANAVQAMGEKGGNLTLKVSGDGQKARISITDTGPGIPRDQLGKIFDPFYTTKEAGTGIGLSITKKIIDEHHGAIQVNSREGAGTTFLITLSQAQL